MSQVVGTSNILFEVGGLVPTARTLNLSTIKERAMNQVFADLSSNNSHFDAAQYRNAGGHVFVAIKATEGTGYINPKHRSWCYAAGLHHIGIGHYHFALATDPVKEARFFWDVVASLAGPRDYLILDMERGVLERDPAWCKTFDNEIRKLSRFNTIVYGSESWLSVAPANAWLAGPPYRFWDADWSGNRDFAPKGGVCVMRQSSDGVFGPEPHSLLGVGQCDVNHLRGGFAANVLSQA